MINFPNILLGSQKIKEKEKKKPKNTERAIISKEEKSNFTLNTFHCLSYKIIIICLLSYSYSSGWCVQIVRMPNILWKLTSKQKESCSLNPSQFIATFT